MVVEVICVGEGGLKIVERGCVCIVGNVCDHELLVYVDVVVMSHSNRVSWSWLVMVWG